MRVLCLVDRCPLPTQSRDDERLVSLLEVWSSMASIDVIVRGSTTDSQRSRLRAHLHGATVLGLPEADTPTSHGKLGWGLRRHVSLDAALVDPRPARRRTLHFAQQVERHDAVFAGDPFMAWLLRPALRPVPWLVDVPVVHGPSPLGEPVSSARAALARVRGRSILELLAVDRAARFELHEAGTAHVATVRSSADREALGSPTAVVISDKAVAREYWALAQATVAGAGTYTPKGWT